jgi:hypothetical protein
MVTHFELLLFDEISFMMVGKVVLVHTAGWPLIIILSESFHALFA